MQRRKVAKAIINRMSENNELKRAATCMHAAYKVNVDKSEL